MGLKAKSHKRRGWHLPQGLKPQPGRLPLAMGLKATSHSLRGLYQPRT